MEDGKRQSGGRDGAQEAIERQIDRWPSAAWAIDTERGVLIAANMGARGLFGLAADNTLNVQWQTFAEIARNLEPGAAKRASFGTGAATGGEASVCEAYRPAEAPRFVIFTVPEAHASEPPLRLTEAERDATGGEPVEPARRARNDAETLIEIARRIRQEQENRERLSDGTGPPLPETTPQGSGAADGDRQRRARLGPGSAPDREARLAHELRTPLAAIMAAAEIMRDERFGALGDARYRGYAADIHESARHALGVIKGMLGGRTQETLQDAREQQLQLQLQLQFAEIDIGVIAASAVSSMQPLAAAAGVALRLETGARLPHVIADAVSVRQILLNLLTNALKFTARGGSVDMIARHRPDEPLVIEVRDTGTGMNAEELAFALGRGPPAATINAQRSVKDGLGIGLTIVRTLAAANGAEIAIASAAGMGTAVTVAFGRERLVPV